MIIIKSEVMDALKNKIGVVALESTIITHGMPYPQNVETALNVEKVIRDNGAVPATIAIIDGVIRVGLTKEEIESLSKNEKSLKVSKRDLAYVVSQGKTGSTTVAATMLITKMAGIEIFATGGIGGVHINAADTFDVSRDLEELGETDVSVVCAGAKAILDLGLTLEYLETKGVEVIGYKTKKLPAFYTKDSEFDVDYSLDTPKDIAKLIKTKRDLKIGGGILIVNPIPNSDSIDKDIINKHIADALESADRLGIKGKEITPYLLKTIAELTGGNSLKANIKLISNNAELAARIAREINKL